MARLLIDGEWYDALSPDAIFERDFEELLLANAAHLYPAFVATRFKATVESEYGRARADLALIDRDYRTWWVVEVELGSHPLRAHVEGQVAVLATGRYGEDEAHGLSRQGTALNFDALCEMMRGQQPRVLVIVNQSRPEWASTLARWNAMVGVAEVFRSRDGRMVLRINGEHPQAVGDVLSVCRVDNVLPSSLRVDSPAGLGFSADESAEVWFDGSLTPWSRLDTGGGTWLIPTGRYPLPAGVRTFVLRRGQDGRLGLEEQD